MLGGTRRRMLGAIMPLLLLLAATPRAGDAASPNPLALPAGLPAHFGFGLAARPDSTGIDGWMPQSGLPWDYAYQYLTGGVNTGRGWETWDGQGTFPLLYARDAASHGYIPVFPYYELEQGIGFCHGCEQARAQLTNLNDARLMGTYYQNFALLMQRLGPGTYGGIRGYGKPAIVEIEPTLSANAELAVLTPARCFGFCTARGNDPANLRAAVARSGVPALAAYPDTYQGFNWALLHLRDLYAPNVLLAEYVSNYATGTNIGTDPSGGIDAVALGREVGAFAARSGGAQAPAGTSRYDLLFNDVGDRDAGYDSTVLHDPAAWWDRLNIRFPNFHRWEAYIHAIGGLVGRPVLVWQAPLGNQFFDTENNTPGHYQDNRVEYFFGHVDELARAGIIGVLFGAVAAGDTVEYDADRDGVTNPAAFCTSYGLGAGKICNTATSTVPDDDGGYLRLAAQHYYDSGGYPLAAAPIT